MPQQVLRLRAPRQQLAVEQQPAGAELGEQPGLLRRRPQAVHEQGGQPGGEERAPGPRPHRPERVARRAEAGPRDVEAGAHERHRP